MKDQEKQFEGSYTRIVAVMCITYIVVFGYFTFLGAEKPYLNAVVPTIGFNLSTWSLSGIKALWMMWRKERKDRNIADDDNMTYQLDV